MKLTPVPSPAAIQQAPDQSQNLKARAVEAFNKASTPTPPANHSAQLNQNAISPEDMGAIQAHESRAQEETIPLAEVVETLKAEPVEPKEQDPALSRQFAQLARQERAIRQQKQQQDQVFKTREAQLQAREQELANKQPDMSKYIPRDQLKSEILDMVARGEVPYEEITQQMLNPTQRDPRVEANIKRLEDQIKRLESQNEEARKSYADNQNQAYQSAVKQIETDVRALVKSDPNFETIKVTGSAKDVVELITQTYDKDGVLLTVEEAAQQVEDYLTEEALKLTQIGKIKKRMQQNQQLATGSPVQKSLQQTQSAQQQPMKTLTNAAASSRKLTARERALLAFKGELK